MGYNFSFNDQDLFNELLKDPFLSYHAICKKLNLSSSYVTSRFDAMKKHGLLRGTRTINDPIVGERMQTEITALYSYSSIGLVRQHVFFERIPSTAALDALIRFCDAHPYTHYRALAFGNSSVLYTQFDVPSTIVDAMQEVYQEVANLIGVNAVILNGTTQIDFLPDFSYWSTIAQEWNFGDRAVSDRVFTVDNLWHSFLKNPEEYISDFAIDFHSGKYSMNELDAALLRELTINPKTPLDLLVNTYGKSKSTISRQIAKLKEHVIYRGKLLFDEQHFGLNSYYIMRGKFSDKTASSNFQQFFKNNQLPLQGFLSVDNLNFVAEIRSSPNMAAEVNRFLWANTDSAKFRVYNVHIPSTFLYFFYNANYRGKGIWHTDADYIEKNPLTALNS